jgi:hypothetical protein
MAFMGIGRAGKTATIRSIQAKPFEETESTIGLERLNVKVSLSKDGDGEEQSWEEVELPEKELETALVRKIMNQADEANVGGEEQNAKESIVGSINKSNQPASQGQQLKGQQSPTKASQESIDGSNQQLVPGKQVAATSQSDIAGSASGTDLIISSSQSQLPSSVHVDEDFVARAMKEKAQVSNGLVMTIVDMGGQTLKF